MQLKNQQIYFCILAFLLQAYIMPVFANTLSNNYSSQSISNALVEQVPWKYRTYKGKSNENYGQLLMKNG